jgi:hypothetical protein
VPATPLAFLIFYSPYINIFFFFFFFFFFLT